MALDILDKIYLKRATMLLEDHCEKIGLNFDRFNDYLQEHDAILIGSMALSCFDIKIIPNDMDIFIFPKEGREHNKYKWNFHDCFNDKTKVKYESLPIHNIFKKDNKQVAGYRWIFKNKEDDYKLVDLVLYNITLEEYNRLQTCTLDGFYWNGQEWNVPVVNITNFFQHKICEIKQICTIDVLIMYEPWLFAENIGDLNKIFYYGIKCYIKKLVEMYPFKFSYLLHDDDDIISTLNKFFGKKELMIVDLYLLIKTYYRVYKYMDAGYKFPTFGLCITDAYDKLPTYNDYMKQIEETNTITLPSGHKMEIKSRFVKDSTRPTLGDILLSKYLQHINGDLTEDNSDEW